MSGRLQLPAVLQRMKRRIAQQRNHGNKKLRTDHIHFLIFVRDIHDSIVIQFIVNLKQRHKHRIFTVLFTPVLVKLFKKILIFMLGGCFVHFIFHLKHN